MKHVTSSAKMVATLRTLLRQALQLRTEGAGCLSLGRAQGYADGYLRGLQEAGILSEKEALTVVAEERAAHAGPATRFLSEDISVAA
jgi:hypothetical protein